MKYEFTTPQYLSPSPGINQPNQGENVFTLFTIAAYIPDDGTIVLQPTVVAAKDTEHAKRLAIAAVVKANADQDLEVLRIEAVPFGR